MAFTTKVISDYNRAAYASRLSLSESAALFDITNEIMKNASAQACIAEMAKNKTCINSLISLYESAYGIGFEISSQGVTAGHASTGKTVCLALDGKAVCITAGG